VQCTDIAITFNEYNKWNRKMTTFVSRHYPRKSCPLDAVLMLFDLLRMSIMVSKYVEGYRKYIISATIKELCNKLVIGYCYIGMNGQTNIKIIHWI
jgi:hypothetical protein